MTVKPLPGPSRAGLRAAEAAGNRSWIEGVQARELAHHGCIHPPQARRGSLHERHIWRLACCPRAIDDTLSPDCGRMAPPSSVKAANLGSDAANRALGHLHGKSFDFMDCAAEDTCRQRAFNQYETALYKNKNLRAAYDVGNLYLKYHNAVCGDKSRSACAAHRRHQKRLPVPRRRCCGCAGWRLKTQGWCGCGLSGRRGVRSASASAWQGQRPTGATTTRSR